MKSFFLIVLVLTAGYLAFQLNAAKERLAETKAELEKAKLELGSRASAPVGTNPGSWLQQKIAERSSALESGAYNHQTGVARGATRYYTGAKTVTVNGQATPVPTPVDSSATYGRSR